MNTYTLHSPYRLWLRDASNERQQLLFHVRSGDYFATLATVLGLINDLSELDPRSKDTLERIRDDLVYLQSTHAIVPRYDRQD